MSVPPPSAGDLSLIDYIETLHSGSGWGQLLRGYRQVDSTNTAARTWAASGAPEGSVVLAEEQTAGRGRMGRQWKARSGQNLLFSIVLRPRLPLEHRGLITLAAGVAVAQILQELVAPHEAAIKWPNDILLEGSKCCGMLLETVHETGRSQQQAAVILGIGLNVNQVHFPEAIEERATSLRLTAGRPIDRAPLFVQLLRALERWYDRLHRDPEAVRTAFTEKMVNNRESVVLRWTDSSRPIEGSVEGIDETGGLRLRQGNRIRVFHAGEVTFN